MVLITNSGPDTIKVGQQGPDFSNLPSTDGKTYSLNDFADAKALVLSFTCNHCPYAKAYEQRFIDLAREYQPKGIKFVAINVNDADNYPDDSFENMKIIAKEKAYPFPYLRDESQDVAKAYGAVCTPHIFVLDANKALAYEGHIDDNWQEPENVKSRDLKNALDALLADQPVPQSNTNPMGCSIKWKQ